MSDYPNIARLDQIDPDKLTVRQIQTHMIRQDYEAKHPVAPSPEKTARMAAAVPALLAHIDELYGQIENLRKSVDAPKRQALVEELALVRTESVEAFVRGRLERHQSDSTQTQEDDWRIAARIDWNRKHPALAGFLKMRGVR